MYSTEILVLKKILYQDTSLIINAISPKYGKMDFLIKGARAVKKKKFPIVDLFRVLSIDFKYNEGRLQPLYSINLVTNNDAIVNNPQNFIDFCELNKFLLRNTQPLVSSEFVYNAYVNALSNLSSYPNYPWCYLIKMCFLHENGLLPEIENFNLLLNIAIGNSNNFYFNEGSIKNFQNKIDEICVNM